MSYRHVAMMAADPDLAQRVTACAAIEGIPEPWVWQNARAWRFAATPGWGEQYAYALDIHKEEPEYRPGWDEAVITDADILSAVQVIRQEDAAPSQEEPQQA